MLKMEKLLLARASTRSNEARTHANKDGASLSPPDYGFSQSNQESGNRAAPVISRPVNNSDSRTAALPARSAVLNFSGSGSPVQVSPTVDSQTNNAEKPQRKPGELGSAGLALMATSQQVFESKVENIGELSSKQQRTKKSQTKIDEAKAAVVPPQEEEKSMVKMGIVEKVEESSRGLQKPNTEVVRNRVGDFPVIRALFDIPDTTDDLNTYLSRGYQSNLATGDVKKQLFEVSGLDQTFESIPQDPQVFNPSQASVNPIPGLERARSMDTIHIGQGLLGELDDAFLDMSQEQQMIDQQFEEEGLTEERLALVNSGELFEAKMAKGFIDTHVKDGPERIKEEILREKQRTVESLSEEEMLTRKEMGETRRSKLIQSQKQQIDAKDNITTERKGFSDRIKDVYEDTKGKIDDKLGALETDHIQPFAKFLKDEPEQVEGRIRTGIRLYMERRQSGWSKYFVKAWDWAFTDAADLPESKRIIRNWTNRFKEDIKTKVEALNGEINTTITDCKNLIQKAKTDIDNEAAIRGGNITVEEEKALANIRQKLSDLREDVVKSESELMERVQNMRTEAIQDLDNRIEKMREEMSSAVSKAARLIKRGAIKLFKYVLEEIGINPDPLIDIIGKVFSVLWEIVKDPGSFIGNLIDAGKKGLFDFVEGIGGYIKDGFFEWIMDFLGDLNIQKLPERFNLQGIASVVFQVLGLTWQNIRAKLAKPENLGEETVSKLERGVEGARDLIYGLRKEGPMYLYHVVEDKLGEVQTQITESLKSWAIVEMVERGVTEVVKFLIPGGGFAKAVMAIYDTVMFFWHNRDRILSFMQSVFNAIGDIAYGNIGPAAAGITNTLAKTIPMILSFFAHLLHIDGVGKAVRKAVDKVRQPVERIMDKIIGYISNIVSNLFEKGRNLVERGKESLRTAAGRVVSWWRLRKKFKDKNGESHSLYFEGGEKGAELMVASTPQLVSDLINEILSTDEGKEVASKVRGKLQAIYNRKLKITTGASKEEANNQAIAAEIEQLVVDVGELLSEVSLGGKRKSFPKITLEFQTPPNYQRYPSEMSEYRRQLKEQESAMNAMTIAKWMTNRYVFERYGERIPDDKLRSAENRRYSDFQDFRQMQIDKYENEILPGLSEEERETIKRPSDHYIRQMWNYERAATHRLDQIAGGDHYDFSGVGDSYLNSYIGGQWHANKHVDTLVEVIEKIDPSVYGSKKMNVTLIVK